MKAMKKMDTIDYKCYQSLGTGSLVQNIETGASSGKRILFDFYFRLFRELIPSIFFSLIFIATINKNMMIYILLGYLVVFATTNILLKYLYRVKARILNNEEVFNKILIHSFMELVVFRIHKKFPKELSHATNAAEQIIESKTKMTLIHEAFFTVFAFFMTLMKVMILFISWKNDVLSVGALVALLTLIDKAYTPIAIFNVLFVQHKLDQSAFSRFSEFLDMPDDLMLRVGKDLESVEGNLSFKNVCFSYEQKHLFSDLSFDIPAGSSVALVGESGSGKSTIVKQVVGLLKPDSGTIYIDENDMSELNLNQLYNHLSYTSQESPIFDGTLRENMIFDVEVSDDKILEALDNVGLTAFYESLPNGLSTEVGEKGTMLSGGERQRIALARLYFKDAKIVGCSSNSVDRPKMNQICRRNRWRIFHRFFLFTDK
ncbi:ATP-binding cassette subfamily B protein [Enterococcus alcedinis]|nr:ATP-binding cassette subfamily B protein [Enterococcus alcedinis]